MNEKYILKSKREKIEHRGLQDLYQEEHVSTAVTRGAVNIKHIKPIVGGQSTEVVCQQNVIEYKSIQGIYILSHHWLQCLRSPNLGYGVYFVSV